MHLNQYLIKQFGNLPYLSKIECIKHLDHYELLKLAVICDGWIEVVGPFLSKEENKKEIAITLKTMENSAEVTVARDPWSEEDVRLSIDFVISSTDQIFLKTPELITFHSKDNKTHQSTILSTIRLFRSLFQVLFHRIHLNFDFGFSVKFLESLEPESSQGVVWLKLEAEKVRVNGAELGKILEKFDVQGKRKLNIKTMRNFKGGDYLLKRSIELDNCKWITGRMLVETFNSLVGIFRNCHFSERDYNLFLKKFKDGTKINMGFVEFRSEKPLNLDRVLMGLEAKPWDPAFRSRKKDGYGISLAIFDLADGWDIVSKREKQLGTVHLSENQKVLQFHSWQANRKFPLPSLNRTVKRHAKLIKRILKEDDLTEKEREFHKRTLEELNEKIRVITKELEDNC